MRILIIGAVAAAALSLSACAGLASFMTPAAQPLEQAAVTVAVSVAVSKGVPAAQIASIARQILAVDNGATVAISEVEALVNAKIAALKLPPADVAAVLILNEALVVAVNAQIASATQGVLSPNTQVAIATVCKWVIAATGATGA